MGKNGNVIVGVLVIVTIIFIAVSMVVSFNKIKSIKYRDDLNSLVNDIDSFQV